MTVTEPARAASSAYSPARPTLFLAILLTFGCSTAAADDPCLFTPSTAEKLIKPYFPRDEQYTLGEGWVVLNYCVNTEGQAEQILVQATTGTEAFERAAIKALKASRFQPATRGGAPVQHCDRRSKYTFEMDPPAKQARRSFARAYREARDYLEAGDEAAAEPIIARLEQQGFKNLYEISYHRLLRGMLADLRGAYATAVDAYESALDSGASRLPSKTVAATRLRVFKLAVARGRYAAALDTYSEAKADATKKRVLADYNPFVDQVNALLTNAPAFATQGLLRGQCWSMKLLRRSFYLAEVEGQLDGIELRCGEHYAAFANVDDAWLIPESWGECSLFVNGREGTTFKVVQQFPGEPVVAQQGSP